MRAITARTRLGGAILTLGVVAILIGVSCSNDSGDDAKPDGGTATVTAEGTATGDAQTEGAASPTATTAEGDAVGATLYIGDTGGGGVSLRSECDREAREPGVWADGTEVQVVQVGADDCDGWRLVRSGGTVSWVSESYLVETRPAAAAVPTGAASPPAPTVAPTTVVPAPTSSPGGPSDAKELLVITLFKLDNVLFAMRQEGDSLIDVTDWGAKELSMLGLVSQARVVPETLASNQTLILLGGSSCELARVEIENAAEAAADIGRLYYERYLRRPLFGSNDADLIDELRETYQTRRVSTLNHFGACA